MNDRTVAGILIVVAIILFAFVIAMHPSVR